MSRKVFAKGDNGRVLFISGIDHALGGFYQIEDYRREEGQEPIFDADQMFGINWNLTGIEPPEEGTVFEKAQYVIKRFAEREGVIITSPLPDWGEVKKKH